MAAAHAAVQNSYKWGAGSRRAEVNVQQYQRHQKIMLNSSRAAGGHLHAGNIFFNVNVSSSGSHPSSSAGLVLCGNRKSEEKCLFSSERTRTGVLKRGRACQSSVTDTDTFSSSSQGLPMTTRTTYNTTTHNDIPSFTTRRPEDDEVGAQELTVYEVNEGDRSSPVFLPSSKLAVDWYNRLQVVGGLGDLVPFSNKLFDGSLKKRLGITAGIISVIRYYPEQQGLLFEAVYSFYFGDYGHISVKGPYKSHEDTILTVTGGSGVFTGVYGTVKIHNVDYPIVLFYTFKLYGIPQLPQALRWKTLPPSKSVRPSPNASLPGVALPNFTD